MFEMAFRADQTVLTSNEVILPIQHVSGDFLETMNGPSAFMSSHSTGPKDMVEIILHNKLKIVCSEDVMIGTVIAPKPMQRYSPACALRYIEAFELRRGMKVLYRGNDSTDMIMMEVKEAHICEQVDSYSFDGCASIFVNRILCHVNDVVF
jgi:hypothetical protein